MNNIKVEIIGCGNIGKRHIAVFDQNPSTDIIGICDINNGAATEQASIYANSFPIRNNFNELITSSKADLISICTPHHLHRPMTIEALNAGKNVLVEKPMALTVSDSKAMIESAKTNNKRLYVMKQNRFNVPITITKEALDQNKLGKIYMVQCNVYWNRNPEYYSNSDWRGQKAKEGGALFTQASHFIDLLIWWFGDVVAAKAMIDTKMQNVEVEDCGNAVMDFKSGVQGSIMWTTCVYNKNYEGSITIVGEKGTIKIGGKYLNKIDFWDVENNPLADDIDFTDLPNNYGKYQGTSSNHHKVVAEIIRDLNGEKSNIVEGEEGLKSIEAMEMIYKDAGL